MRDGCGGENLGKTALHQRVVPRNQDNDDEWVGCLMRKDTDVQMNADSNDCDHMLLELTITGTGDPKKKTSKCSQTKDSTSV